MGFRVLCASLLCGVAAWAAGGPDSIDQAVARLQQQTEKLAPGLRMEFRMRAVQSLAERHPEQARKLVSLVVQEVNAGKEISLTVPTIQAFAAAAPVEGIAILPHLANGESAMMTASLARANHMDQALGLYRQSLAHGDLQPGTASQLLTKLVKESPDEARKLFRDMLAAAHIESLEPMDAYYLLNCAKAVAAIDATLASQACERVAKAASSPEYGAGEKTTVTGTFQLGANSITTSNSRDTVLVISGNSLREWNRPRFEEMKATFSQWDLSGPLVMKGLSFRGKTPGRVDTPVEAADISRKMSRMRSLPTDADRARLVLEVTREIQALPVGIWRVNLATSVANLSTEGDLGKEALTAVSETLAQALHDSPAQTGDAYIELASLVRFEHLPAPKPDPALDAAGSLIALEGTLHQEAGFTLTGLDGKTYSLADLRGKVVLLNFWATWCPPCRKEMPDMEKLYKTLQSKGLVVLAVSDEDRETVAKFEEKQQYTFPILLDPDRKVNDAFNVQGIPKSFLFDREGKLVAQAIDMRTETQFVEMLKSAGM